jgi:hypothetical protein
VVADGDVSVLLLVAEVVSAAVAAAAVVETDAVDVYWSWAAVD